MIMLTLACLAAAFVLSTEASPGYEWRITDDCTGCIGFCDQAGIKKCKIVCSVAGDIISPVEQQMCRGVTPADNFVFDEIPYAILPCETNLSGCAQWTVNTTSCGPCIAPCGSTGHRECSAQCTRNGVVVAANNCAGIDLHLPMTVPCEGRECKYSWTILDDNCSPCSGPCGSQGTKDCEVVCMDENQNAVESALCTSAAPNSEVPCRTAPCSYEWGYSEWSECEGPCGMDCAQPRIRTRRPICYQIGSRGDRIPVDARFCGKILLLPITEICPPIPCDYTWVVGRCSECVFESYLPDAIAQSRAVTVSADSKPCGPSRKFCSVFCVNSQNRKVDSALCTDPRPSSVVDCESVECDQFAYGYTDFGLCDVKCGTGTMHRKAFCYNVNTGAVVDDAQCNHLTREDLSKECDMPPCQTVCEWFIGRWSDCVARQNEMGCSTSVENPTRGYQYRKVACQCGDTFVFDETACRTAQGGKPADTQECLLAPCNAGSTQRIAVVNAVAIAAANNPNMNDDSYFEWHFEEFGECISPDRNAETPCGLGLRYRRVYCYSFNNRREVDDSFCKYLRRPASTEPCKFEDCTYKWVFSQWSECAGAPDCFRTRKVSCYSSAGFVVDDSYCGLPCTKPLLRIACDCPATDCSCGEWGRLSPCSVKCGQGVQYKSRTCTEATNGGKTCQELGLYSREVTFCFTPCPVDCYCTAWEVAKNCSLPCGGGIISYTRKCAVAMHGGLSCEALGLTALTMTKPCNECPCDKDFDVAPVTDAIAEPIPVSCRCEEWSAWTPCSAKCGGYTYRKRNCYAPNRLGATCEQLGYETMQKEPCGIPDCRAILADSIVSTVDSALTNVGTVTKGMVGDARRIGESDTATVSLSNRLESWAATWGQYTNAQNTHIGSKLVELGNFYLTTVIDKNFNQVFAFNYHGYVIASNIKVTDAWNVFGISYNHEAPALDASKLDAWIGGQILMREGAATDKQDDVINNWGIGVAVGDTVKYDMDYFIALSKEQFLEAFNRDTEEGCTAVERLICAKNCCRRRRHVQLFINNEIVGVFWIIDGETTEPWIVFPHPIGDFTAVPVHPCRDNFIDALTPNDENEDSIDQVNIGGTPGNTHDCRDLREEDLASDEIIFVEGNICQGSIPKDIIVDEFNIFDGPITVEQFVGIRGRLDSGVSLQANVDPEPQNDKDDDGLPIVAVAAGAGAGLLALIGVAALALRARAKKPSKASQGENIEMQENALKE